MYEERHQRLLCRREIIKNYAPRQIRLPQDANTNDVKVCSPSHASFCLAGRCGVLF